MAGAVRREGSIGEMDRGDETVPVEAAPHEACRPSFSGTEDQSSYSRAVAALKKRFRSVEIEELKGLEFHRRVQGDETIEQLGMDLQKLGLSGCRR